MQQVIGRFAPSPSGRMHLGNVLCALLSWLGARSENGGYLLRIEDLDTVRCPRENAQQVIDDLRWLGLDWDEIQAPPKRYDKALAGVAPQVRRSAFQSERTQIYEYFAALLAAQGLTYPCFCTRAELHAASAPHQSDGQVVYSGACRGLSSAQVAARQLRRAPALRVCVPAETIAFTDGCAGPYAQALAAACGDFIIRRSDGMFAYQLAVTVDDALMGVTQVVRGNDLLASAPRQIWLHRQFGFTPPAFYHIPLLCAPDGRRLSKREGDLDLGALRQRMPPQRLLGVLAAAAGVIDRPQPVSARELVGEFAWSKVSKQDIKLQPSLLG